MFMAYVDYFSCDLYLIFMTTFLVKFCSLLCVFLSVTLFEVLMLTVLD